MQNKNGISGATSGPKMIRLSAGDNRVVGGVNVSNFANPVTQVNHFRNSAPMQVVSSRNQVVGLGLPSVIRAGMAMEGQTRSRSIGF